MFWRTVFLLVAVATTIDCKDLKNKNGTVTTRCWNTIKACSDRHMARGSCRSVWNSIVLQMIRGDTNNLCFVDGDDIERYYEVHIDKNDDGKICHNEWLDFYTSYYGFTNVAANAIFTNKYRKNIKNGCVDIEDADEVDDMNLRTTYLNSLIQDLSSFCTMGQNMNLNRDCWGLVAACKDVPMARNTTTCRQLDLSNTRTLYEKMVLEFTTIDNDKDTILTSQEISDDLRINYDTDRNGCVSNNEWISRFTRFYQFSREFAHTFYASIRDANQDGCINIRDFVVSARGMHMGTRMRNLMSELIKFCEGNPRLYQTNRDCASLVETCNNHAAFFNLQECIPFIRGKCGLRPYSSCLSGQTVRGGNCISDADKTEIKFERLKASNNLDKTCTPDNINAGNKPSTSLAIVIPIAILFMMILQL